VLVAAAVSVEIRREEGAHDSQRRERPDPRLKKRPHHSEGAHYSQRLDAGHFIEDEADERDGYYEQVELRPQRDGDRQSDPARQADRLTGRQT